MGQHSVQPNQLAEFIKHIRPVEYDSKGCVHMVYWGRDLMPWKAARQNLIAAWAVFLPTFCYSSAHGVMAAWMFSEIQSYKYKNGL